MTVSELAVRAGFGVNGRSYISKLEHGLIQHVSDERLQRLAQALDIGSLELQLKRPPTSVTHDDQAIQTDVQRINPPIDPWGLSNRARQGDFLHSAPQGEDSTQLSYPPESEPHRTGLPPSPAGNRPVVDAIDTEALRRVDMALAQIEADLIGRLRQSLREQVRPLLLSLLRKADQSDTEQGPSPHEKKDARLEHSL
jgi:transcriptional regulator with XRE-family HTH domain